MGPRMVNLSECMDPKRYSLEAVPAGAHARFCQAKRIARLRQGWGKADISVFIRSWPPPDLSLAVRMNISDGYLKGRKTASVFLDILNVALASSPPSQTCALPPPFCPLFVSLDLCPISQREGHGKKYFTETSFVLK